MQRHWSGKGMQYKCQLITNEVSLQFQGTTNGIPIDYQWSANAMPMEWQGNAT